MASLPASSVYWFSHHSGRCGFTGFPSERWRPGVFFDLDSFRPSVYQKHWGTRMLNHDAKILTIQQFVDSDETPPDVRWFIKPDDDLKRFTGGVMTQGDFREWYAETQGRNRIGPQTKIVVCEPKTMGHEWRLFFVSGKIVGASRYSADGRDLPVPTELEHFAVESSSIWSPAAAFALDVTMDEEGAPRIVETNCINGSGLYFADARAIVRALSVWQEINWENERGK